MGHRLFSKVLKPRGSLLLMGMVPREEYLLGFEINIALFEPKRGAYSADRRRATLIIQKTLNEMDTFQIIKEPAGSN